MPPLAPSALLLRRIMHPALAAQWSSNNPSAINDLLDDFGTLLDTEWRLLLTLGSVLVSMVYGIMSVIVIWSSRGAVHWGFRLSLYVSWSTFVLALIFLVEPRPSHWLARLSEIEHSVWTSHSVSEQRMRMRRWWRWRKKYATNTRLNV